MPGSPYRLIDLMRPMPEGRGIAIASTAIARPLRRDFVSTVIVGAKRPDQLAPNLAASDVVRAPEEIALLDAASALEPE